jgi:uncharacterized protein YerC
MCRAVRCCYDFLYDIFLSDAVVYFWKMAQLSQMVRNGQSDLLTIPEEGGESTQIIPL